MFRQALGATQVPPNVAAACTRGKCYDTKQSCKRPFSTFCFENRLQDNIMGAAAMPRGSAAASHEVLSIELDGASAWLTFNRPDKRNAVNDALLNALGDFFSSVPEGVRVVIL